MADSAKFSPSNERIHKSQTAQPTYQSMPERALPVPGLRFAGDLTKPENSLPFLIQTLAGSNKRQESCEKMLFRLLATIDRKSADDFSAEQRGPMVRMSLTEDDIKRIDDMGTEKIHELFKTAGEVLRSNVVSNRRKNNVLLLRLKSLQFEDQVWKSGPEIANLLGLSQQCRVRTDVYLIEATRCRFDKLSRPDAMLSIPRWSKDNDITFIRGFWKSNRLVLALASLEDALFLIEKGKLYLNGREAVPRAFDLRSIPFWCFNCAQPKCMDRGCPNATQCGRCSGSHRSHGCTTQPLYCPVCGTQGHESWNKKCKNKANVEMRKECDKLYGEGPMWWKLSKQGQAAQKSGRKGSNGMSLHPPSPHKSHTDALDPEAGSLPGTEASLTNTHLSSFDCVSPSNAGPALHLENPLQKPINFYFSPIKRYQQPKSEEVVVKVEEEEDSIEGPIMLDQMEEFSTDGNQDYEMEDFDGENIDINGEIL